MGNRRIAALAAVTLAIAATGAQSASAEPNFQSPAVAASHATALPALAVDGAGNAIVAYTHSTAAGRTLFVATRPAGASAWSAPEALTEPLFSEFVAWAAFDNAGNATVAWAQSSDGTGRVATRPVGAATFQPAQQIATGVAAGSSMGVDFDMSRSGAALMTWGRTSDRKVNVARRPLGASSFEPEQSLGFGYDSASGSVGEDGTMAVTGHQQGEAAKIRVRPAGSSDWEPVVDLGAVTFPLALPNSAVDASGNVLALWIEGNTGAARRLKTRFRPAGAATAFAAPEEVAEVPGTDPYGPEFFGSPQLAFDVAGNATLLWMEIREAGNGAPWRVFTTTRPAGGPTGAPQPLSADGPDVEYARLAVAPDGTALAVWRQFDAPRAFSGDFRDQNEGPVLAAARVGGTWRAPQTLTPSRAYQPAVAITNGAGAVGWIRTHGGDCRQLEVSSFVEGPATALDPPAVQCGPPPPADTTPPTSALGGERTQRAHHSKRVLVTLACDEPCAGTVKSELTMKRKGAKTASKPVRLPNVKYTTAQTEGRLLTFKLRLSTSLAKKLEAVLAARGSAVVVARTTARDAAGNAGPSRRKSVKLIR